jgi:hypothetical protein
MTRREFSKTMGATLAASIMANRLLLFDGPRPAMAARMRDRRYAEMLQLLNEYDPHPPFHAGTPAQAGPEVTDHLLSLLAPGIDSARDAASARKKLSASEG